MLCLLLWLLLHNVMHLLLLLVLLLEHQEFYLTFPVPYAFHLYLLTAFISLIHGIAGPRATSARYPTINLGTMRWRCQWAAERACVVLQFVLQARWTRRITTPRWGRLWWRASE